MSAFTSFVSIQPSPKERKRVTTSSLTYFIGSEDSNESITVPPGYEFDGASVPMLLGWVLQRVEPDTITSACLHDYIYTYHRHHGRLRSDLIFLESLLVYNIPRLLKEGKKLKASICIAKYVLMFIGLHIFSWRAWYRSK